MKTDFLTLWVDDNIPFAQSVEANLKDWLDDKGYELRVSIHADETGVLNEISNSDIELIIIDYRLPGENGDVLIERIRRQDFYQDIIFYSEDTLPDKRLDGVFYVRKEDAVTRIRELIELKLRRSSDPVSVRGWIVADSIELEGMVTALISACFQERKGFTFSDRLLGDNGPLEFGVKYMLLNGLLKDHIAALTAQNPLDDRLNKLRPCKKILDDFSTEVIVIRNAIAHQKVEDLGSGKIIKLKTKAATEIPLNEETFIQIRKDLRKHRDNLDTLKSLL